MGRYLEAAKVVRAAMDAAAAVLFQQQDVGGFHQNGQQVQPPPFSAAEPSDGD